MTLAIIFGALAFAGFCIILTIGLQRHIVSQQAIIRQESDTQAIALAKKTAEQQFISMQHYQTALQQLKNLRQQAYTEYTKAHIGAFVQKLEAEYHAAVIADELPDTVTGALKLF